MHELAVTKSILNICLDEEKKRGFKIIKEINLSVGEFCGLVPNCIDYYFKIVSSGTVACNAKINVKKIKARINCFDCSYEGEIDEESYICPKCGGFNFKVIGGNEFYLESIEVE